MFLKISRAVGCVILSQMGLYYLKKNLFLEKWLRLHLPSASSWHKTSKRSSESESWDKVAKFWTKLSPNCLLTRKCLKSLKARVESLKERVEIQKCEFKSNPRVAGWNPRVTSSNPRVMSLNPRVQDHYKLNENSSKQS